MSFLLNPFVSFPPEDATLTLLHQIDTGRTGGGTVDGWAQDSYFTGGIPYSWNAPGIDVSGVTDPAPEAVYQYIRFDGASYTYDLPGFTPNSGCFVRLHFQQAESATGARVFDVEINGAVVFDNVDIAALVGNVSHKAVVLEANAAANGAGVVQIKFICVVQNAVCSGIQAYQSS